MHLLQDGYKSLGLLIDVNRDRLFFVALIVLGLMTAAYIGSRIAGF